MNMSVFNLQPNNRQMDKGKSDASGGGSSVVQKDASMTVGKWMGTLVLLAIPLCNVICFIVWLFGGGKNRSRTNYVRASLFISLILVALSVIAVIAFGGTLQEILQKILENLGQ
jgi:hypothetical protein